MKHMVVVYEIEDDAALEDMLSLFPKAASLALASGVKVRQVSTGEEAFIPYARWFDKDSTSWFPSPHEEYNWMFLRSQQNWANDMLRARGYLSLNDAHNVLGLSQTAIGAVVGWVYEAGVNVDFGCWEQEETSLRDDGAILLDFNVQGPILHAFA